MMQAGLNGGVRNGAAALGDNGRVVAVCAEERVTRVRGGGVPGGLPDEALDLLLQRRGQTRRDLSRYVVVDGGALPTGAPAEALDHHRAHASVAYLSSPFAAAAIVVCDHDEPGVSVWSGDGGVITRVDWPRADLGFAAAYFRVAAALGFHTGAAGQRLEALARLQPGVRDAAVDALFGWRDGALIVDPALEQRLAQMAGSAESADILPRARVASAAQARLGELVVALLADVQQRLGAERLCVGGSLFYQSYLNTLMRRSGLFAEVFVPVDPGDSGLAVGAVLHGMGGAPAPVSPFLGPAYSAEEVKAVLDNCKLNYSWESEEGAVAAAVHALREGHLVGWFDGGMEWGPRALGASWPARCSPTCSKISIASSSSASPGEATR